MDRAGKNDMTLPTPDNGNDLITLLVITACTYRRMQIHRGYNTLARRIGMPGERLVRHPARDCTRAIFADCEPRRHDWRDFPPVLDWRA